MRWGTLRNAACCVVLIVTCCFFTFAAHGQLSTPTGVAAEEGGALVPPMFQAPLPCASAGELKVLGELRGYWVTAYNQANLAWSDVTLDQHDYDAAESRVMRVKTPMGESEADIRIIDHYQSLVAHYHAALGPVRTARANYDKYLDQLTARKCPLPQLPPPSTVPVMKTDPPEPATKPGAQPTPATPSKSTPIKK